MLIVTTGLQAFVFFLMMDSHKLGPLAGLLAIQLGCLILLGRLVLGQRVLNRDSNGRVQPLCFWSTLCALFFLNLPIGLLTNLAPIVAVTGVVLLLTLIAGFSASRERGPRQQ